MAASVLYKFSVERDLKRIDPAVSGRPLHKLEQVLSSDPQAGEPLGGEFRGLFKYRMGDSRVIYTRVPEGVLVLRIGHRREVYRSLDR